MPDVAEASNPDDQQERDEIAEKLLASLGKLKRGLDTLDPRNGVNEVMANIKKSALAYADLADARKTTLELELAARPFKLQADFALLGDPVDGA